MKIFRLEKLFAEIHFCFSYIKVHGHLFWKKTYTKNQTLHLKFSYIYLITNRKYSTAPFKVNTVISKLSLSLKLRFRCTNALTFWVCEPNQWLMGGIIRGNYSGSAYTPMQTREYTQFYADAFNYAAIWIDTLKIGLKLRTTHDLLTKRARGAIVELTICVYVIYIYIYIYYTYILEN